MSTPFMTTPYAHPSFGSWEDVARSFATNPFFSGGAQAQHPLLAYFQQQQQHQRFPQIGQHESGLLDPLNLLRSVMTSDLNPQPLPPRAITALFLFQIAVRDVTSRLPKDQGTELTGRLDQAISDEIDFVCGTVPHPHPPIPGPSPFAFTVAGELNLIGNIMQEGSLRTAVIQLASQIASRASVPVSSKKEPRVAA
jgi:hypothetical protein